MSTLNFLASAGPMANIVVTAAEADKIMLTTDGTIMARGILYNIVSRKVGPSTWKLTLKEANP